MHSHSLTHAHTRRPLTVFAAGSFVQPQRTVDVLCVQVSFGGSRSTLWQPASFWRRGPGQAAAVRVLGFEGPGGEDGGGEGPPPQRMPSQPGTHKLEALSALAQRSARMLWCDPLLIPPSPIVSRKSDLAQITCMRYRNRMGVIEESKCRHERVRFPAEPYAVLMSLSPV